MVILGVKKKCRPDGARKECLMAIEGAIKAAGFHASCWGFMT